MTMGKKGSHLMKGTTNRNGVDCTHKNMGGRAQKNTQRIRLLSHLFVCVCCVHAFVCVKRMREIVSIRMGTLR